MNRYVVVALLAVALFAQSVHGQGGPLRFMTSSLPSGAMGSPYGFLMDGAGGTTPYSWTATGLPSGLSMAQSTGAITGTPTVTGTFSVVVTLRDATNTTVNALFNLVLNSPVITINTASLPPGTVGVAYSPQTLSATGGSTPYTWTILSGSLPGGLTLSSSGTISGTPNAAGAFNFTIQARDTAQRVASSALTLVVNAGAPSITTAALPSGTSGAAYSQSLSATGGTAPYTWAVTTGSLPTGLALSTAGAITGTPTAAGTFPFTVRVTDNASQTATKDLSITIGAPPPSITTASPLPGGTTGAAYSQSLSANGGTAPYTWAVTTGSLPAGLALSTAGAITGTPTAAGTFPFTVRVTDNASQTATKDLSITIGAPPPSITTASPLPGGTTGAAYSQSLSANGGTAPYTWAVTTGSLPAGLALSTAGAITGTPTAAGTFPFTVRVTDNASQTATKDLSITISAPLSPPSITTASPLPGGTTGTAYSQSLSANGGTAPYTWAVTTGSLPAGLALSTAGAITGTPTAAGTFPFTVRVTDNASQTATKDLSITISAPLSPPSITTASPLPGGTTGTAYSQSLSANGGTAPYTWAVTTGSLPAGLALSTAGAITGTPTAVGASAFTVRVTDNASQTATKDFSITISAPLSPPSITTASPLPGGTIGSAYSQTLAATGGTSPYSWSLLSGSLPAGMTLSLSGILSGTPTAAATSNFTIQVNDNNSQSASKQFALTVSAAASTLSISTSSLPAGTLGTSYAQTLTATGGTAPYTWSISNGSLPAGLSLSTGGSISGTATAAATANFTIVVTDSASQTASRSLSIAISGPALSITDSTLPVGVVNTPYAHSLSTTGGISPYAWSVVAGSLAPGLTLSPSGAITGVATAAGSFSFTVRLTDGASPAQSVTKPLTLRIDGQLTVQTSALPAGTVSRAYSQTLAANGGTGPYLWSLGSGVLPPGVTISISGVISGTPMATGTFNFSVRVFDSGGQTAVRDFSILTLPPLTLATQSPLGNGSVGVPYSTTLTVSGGTPPLSWTVVGGQLPPGLSITSSGVLSGTPTAEGVFNFTIQVTDGASQTLSSPLSLTIQTGLTVTTASPLPDAVMGAPYSYQLQGSLSGLSWSIASGELPSGLVLSPTGLINGIPSSAGPSSFTVQAAGGSPPQTATQALRLAVVAGLAITSSSLPAGTTSAGYATVLNASGGIAPYTWTLGGGSLPEGLTLSSSGLISGTPARDGEFSFAVQVEDSSSLRATRSFTISIRTIPVGAIQLTGLPEALNPTQQVPFALSIAAPVSIPLSGTLSISFTSDALVSGDDPAVRFSTGTRSLRFTVPTGSTVATFSTPAILMTGTVSGTVLLKAAIDDGPALLDPVGTILVRPMAPQLTSVSAVRTAGGLRIQVVGFSAERRVMSADFGFDVRIPGGAVQRIDLTRNVEADFDGWYRNPESAPFGSTFLFEQLFTVAGDTTMIQTVVIKLTNGQGSGSTVTAAVISN